LKQQLQVWHSSCHFPTAAVLEMVTFLEKTTFLATAALLGTADFLAMAIVAMLPSTKNDEKTKQQKSKKAAALKARQPL
jgi:hypothetical protein